MLTDCMHQWGQQSCAHGAAKATDSPLHAKYGQVPVQPPWACHGARAAMLQCISDIVVTTRVLFALLLLPCQQGHSQTEFDILKGARKLRGSDAIVQRTMNA